MRLSMRRSRRRCLLAPPMPRFATSLALTRPSLLLLLLLVVARGVLRVVVLQVRLGVMIGIDCGRRGLVGDEALDVVVATVRSGSSPTTQVSFEPPPCELLTTSWPSGSATRVSPPGSTQTSVAVVDGERPQVGVPRAHAVLDEGRDGRELHDRLRDPAARVGAAAACASSSSSLARWRPVRRRAPCRRSRRPASRRARRAGRAPLRARPDPRAARCRRSAGSAPRRGSSG